MLSIDGLWGLAFGNGVLGQPTNTLFFTAGPDDESTASTAASTRSRVGMTTTRIDRCAVRNRRRPRKTSLTRAGMSEGCSEDSVGSPGVVDHKAPGAIGLTTQDVRVVPRQRHGFAVRSCSGE